MGDPRPDQIDLSAVHASMPQGLAVVSADGTFREANDHVLTMLGRSREQVVGHSVLEFVHPDDLGFAIDVISEGQDYGGMVTGPVQFRYVDADGRARTTDLWSRTCLGVPGIDGYVVMMSEESTAEMMSAAVRGIAAGSPVDDVLDLVVRAMSGHPVQAAATFLVTPDGAGPDDHLATVGRWPIGTGHDVVVDPRAGAPWDVVRHVGTGVDVDIADDGCPPWLRHAARAAGIEAIWCRAAPTRDEHDPAVLVVWRTVPGRPSANQERHLADAVAIASLAFDQQAYRSSMERAAFVDPVSGLGSRARFEQLLAADGDGPVEGVLYVDLDGFKQVNDRYGHSAGDRFLAHVASRLVGAVRAHDDVVRVGGDEFVVMCRPPGTASGIEALADRIVRVLGEPFAVDGGGTADIGASVGVVIGGSERPLRERVRMADEAMYLAKDAGRGTWRRAAPPAAVAAESRSGCWRRPAATIDVVGDQR